MVYRKRANPEEEERGFVVNVDEIFPRSHSSAKLALDLGRAALVLGAIAGIPAILLARLVQREIAESDGNYNGEDLAARGEWLGSIGTYFSVLLALCTLAYWRPAIGIVGASLAIVAAITAVALRHADQTRPLGHLARRLRQTTGAMALGGLFLVSFAGFFIGHKADEQARIAAMAQCDALLRNAENATAENQFGVAKEKLDSASSICVGARVEKLAFARANFDKGQTAYNERIAKENAERRAQAEREAAEKRQRDFNSALEDAAKALKQANIDIAKAQWAAADTRVEAASTWLRDVAWPEFTTDKRWLDATKQVDELRKRVAAPLEQQRKAEEAARARQLAAEEAARARKQAAEEAARARAEAAEEAREANKHLLCNDGTRSPTCLCNRASWRGCCSHHGGVSGCE